MTIAPILLASLLASNATGKTLVRQQQGTIVPVAGYSGPLIADDANTVAHLTWNGSALVDSKGNNWTMNGTVPQVAKSGKTPAGAGPYATANQDYSLGTGNDVLDFAGDFSACFVVKPTTVASQPVFFANGTYNVNGYYFQYNFPSAGQASLYPSNGAHPASVSSGYVVGQINVVCGGRAGSNTLLKANLLTLATDGAGTIAPATSVVPRIGRYAAAGSNALDGIVYEAWFSTTTPTDALFTAIQQRVKLRAGITGW